MHFIFCKHVLSICCVLHSSSEQKHFTASVLFVEMEAFYFLFPSYCPWWTKVDRSFFSSYLDQLSLSHTHIHTHIHTSHLCCHIEEGTPKPATQLASTRHIAGVENQEDTYTHSLSHSHTHWGQQQHQDWCVVAQESRGRVISLALNHLLNIGAGGDR